MASMLLSGRDIRVLEKIKDPEANPFRVALTDESLPKDPNVTDQTAYDRVSRMERETVLAMQRLESEMEDLRAGTDSDAMRKYRECVAGLAAIISEQPDYASARNNRAQALRRLYGDGMLVDKNRRGPASPEATDKMEASTTVLSDLDKAISLLSPRTPFSALSPVAARTLSLAYTQRAAIYYATSKALGAGGLCISGDRRESRWTAFEFEEAASRDFAMGGRYGNEIAKGLAVSTNPTAKLCGQIVQEMMKKEYGPVA